MGSLRGHASCFLNLAVASLVLFVATEAAGRQRLNTSGGAPRRQVSNTTNEAARRISTGVTGSRAPDSAMQASEKGLHRELINATITSPPTVNEARLSKAGETTPATLCSSEISGKFGSGGLSDGQDRIAAAVVLDMRSLLILVGLLLFVGVLGVRKSLDNRP